MRVYHLKSVQWQCHPYLLTRRASCHVHFYCYHTEASSEGIACISSQRSGMQYYSRKTEPSDTKGSFTLWVCVCVLLWSLPPKSLPTPLTTMFKFLLRCIVQTGLKGLTGYRSDIGGNFGDGFNFVTCEQNLVYVLNKNIIRYYHSLSLFLQPQHLVAYRLVHLW